MVDIELMADIKNRMLLVVEGYENATYKFQDKKNKWIYVKQKQTNNKLSIFEYCLTSLASIMGRVHVRC